MSLRKIGKWNDIPDYLLPEMPEQGTTIVFKLYNTTFKDIDGKEHFVRSLSLPATSTVYDPKTKKTIPIGIITDTDDKGEHPTFHKFYLEPYKTAGTHNIVIGSSEITDSEYVYLMLASMRANNENASANSTPLYELYDAKENFVKKSKEISEKAAAYAHVGGLKDSDLSDVAILFGIEDTSDLEMVRAQIVMFADGDPKEYMKRIGDEDKEILATIKLALKEGLVYRRDAELRLKSPDVKIVDLSSANDALIPQEYARFIKGHAQGDKMLALLKEQVKGEGRKGGRPKKAE